MKKVLMQISHNGEKFEIWNTEATTLEEAWNEIDSDRRPAEGGCLYFEGDNDEWLVVNGGFGKMAKSDDVNLLTIEINKDMKGASAATTLYELGYDEGERARDGSKIFYKGGKNYKFVSMDHFNGYIYSITLEELTAEEAAALYIVEQEPETGYVKNINTGVILTKEDYTALLRKEAGEEWNSMDDADQGEFDNDFESYCAWSYENSADPDFVECDADGIDAYQVETATQRIYAEACNYAASMLMEHTVTDDPTADLSETYLVKDIDEVRAALIKDYEDGTIEDGQEWSDFFKRHGIEIIG